MSEAHIVDARALQPPEPMHRVLEALDVLPAGDEVILLLYREPFPLYNILAQNGYRHQTEHREDGTVAVHIRHAG